MSWALYDWANSAFATTIMAGFFPVFFKEYWGQGSSANHTTFYLGLANSAAALLVALTAPLFGSVADQGHAKKKFLAVFTILGASSSAGLYFVGLGQWTLAAFFYALASLGFAGGLTFYDSLLVDVSSPGRMDFDSSLGYALGYLGGGLLYAVNILMYLHPEIFHISSGPEGIRCSFVSVGVWWLLFSIPLFLFVHERGANQNTRSARVAWRAGWATFLDTLNRIRIFRPLLGFLIAFIIYNDAVNTIIKMAVDYGLSIGLDSSNLIAALLVTQFVGFPAAIAFGFLGQRIGAKTGILVCLMVYCGVTVYAYRMTTAQEFYGLAVTIGLVQGGVQALSRSLFARMIPAQQAAEYFGFFNMLGKFSAVLGPVLIGATSLLTGNSRSSILVLLVMFILGALLLTRVDSNYQVPSE